MTGIKAIAVQGGRVRREQEVAGGRDIYELPLPAVVTVKEGINLPRYPSVPGRLRAKRKPVTVSEPGTALATTGDGAPSKLPPGSGKQAQVLGNGAKAAPAVVEVLQEIGVLK